MAAQHVACGSRFLVDLPDEILVIIGSSLTPGDIFNISTCCKSLHNRTSFDHIWLNQCEKLEVLSSTDVVEWRRVFSSYKALCRFLTVVKPLLGIWVHQTPELGNVVYVMPGFASVVGCRIIPQKTGPLGLEDGPIQWTPVFEVISDDNGAPVFVLHGREKGQDYIYPGTVKSIDKTCNALLLEVESKGTNEEIDSKVSFSNLCEDDREKLLEIVTSAVHIQVPASTCDLSLFPCLRGNGDAFMKDITRLSERRAMLIKKRDLGWGYIDWNATHEKPPSSSENTDVELDDFLSPGDAIGLTLHAATLDSDFHQWRFTGYLDDSLLALYKMPIPVPTLGQEYAGLWGGTIGDEECGNALFFLVLSYQEQQQRFGLRKTFLTAVKILEGTEIVINPNGSEMFRVDINVPSTKPFLCNSGAVLKAFNGEGIASGYGFRSPGSTPGSLLILEDGRLAFRWQVTGSELTLKRLNLEELLKKGKRVSTIPPIANFSYLMTFFTNVYADLRTMKVLGFVPETQETL